MHQDHATASDGTRLFWRSTGEGAPPVLLTDGIGCAGFAWRHLFPALAAKRRVIHWNYRGHGQSESPRQMARASFEDCVSDLFTILDAAGERSAVLIGHSMGVQVCLEAHRQAPRRVAGLVLVCGAPGHPLDTFHDAHLLAAAFPYFKAAVLAFPWLARWAFRTAVPTELAVQIGLLFEVNRELLRRADLEAYLADVADVDPEVFVRILAGAARHDASAHLAEIDVPTLVVAGVKDTWTPFALSRGMHAAIPGSEMLVLPAGTHTGLLEYPELVAGRIEQFLAERVGPFDARSTAVRPGSPRGGGRAARKPS